MTGPVFWWSTTSREYKLVEAGLRAEGYSVIFASDGLEAVRKAAAEDPDLIILDILLRGDLDGYEVCKRIRAFADVPVIMLTAKTQEADKLRGFQVGADDYLTKPFSSQELLARVKAVLRRAREGSDSHGSSLLKCGDLEIDFKRASVTVKGTRVDLTPTEYRVICELARHPNQVVPRDDLLVRVWGPEYRGELEYVRAYIWHLRRKLEENPSKPKYIVSRPGLGYMLACPPRDQEPT